MALTQQQFQDLRNKGLSTDQIIKFSNGYKPTDDHREQMMSQPEKPKTGNFFSNLVKDPIKTLLVKPATRVGQAITYGVGAIEGGDKGEAIKQRALSDTSVDIPVLGHYDIEGQKSGVAGAKQIAGDALKAGSYLYAPGGAEASLGEKTVLNAAKQGAKVGAATGGLYGAGNALEQNRSAKDVLKGAAIGAGTGALTGGFISGGTQALTSKLPNALTNSAEENYYKTLNPTTKSNKALATKVSPGLLERKVVVMSKQGLEDRATREVQNAGQQIEEAWANLPAGTKVKTSPIVDSLEQLKQAATVTGKDGKQVVIDQAKYRNAQDMQQLIMDIGDDVDAPILRKAKQILDGATYSPQKGVLRVQTATEGSLAQAQTATADAIRSELNKATPNIEKLNKEFTFWKNVQQVIGDTNDRTRGKVPFSEKVLDIGATATGLAKGGLKGAGLLGAGTDLLYRAVNSAGWKTVSAVSKKAIADALAKGDSALATKLLNKVVTNAAVGQITTKEFRRP